MDKKYKIEGNIDFFSELYKSLDQDDKNENEDEENNTCLISNQTLTDRFVKLNCGHLFNYLPLLNDIKNHKEKFNNLEGSHTKLKQDEIRCPYCRNKQTELLPYYEDLYPDKIHGVNCIIPFLNYPNYSSYKHPNSFYGNCCFKIDVNNNYYCVCTNVYNFEDGKTYCYLHSKLMTTKLLKDANLKKKDLAKKAKLKEKEDIKQAKLKEKEEIKLAKLKEKEEKKKNKNTVIFINLLDDEQNEIIQNEIIQNEIIFQQIDLDGCIEILKSGSNKGKKCCKSLYNNNLCKKHFDKLNVQMFK
jgi:hypothetical protein